MDLNNSLSDYAARSGFFAAGPSRSPGRAGTAQVSPFITTDLDTQVPNSIPSRPFSESLPRRMRRMVPRNELEISRPAIARAEKDGDDPSSTTERRGLSQRVYSSTPSTLTRLFAVHAPNSPPSSRDPSFNRRSPTAAQTPTSPEQDPLPLHLYQRGLLDGRYSDINVHVLGKSYNLHRLVLDQAPFFASALSEPWLEASSKEITLHPEEIDPNITTIAFELALKRLYGCPDYAEEAEEALAMVATGSWLEMKEMVDSNVEIVLHQLQPSALASAINVMTTNYYGNPGNRVLATCKSILSREGWLMPIRYWDNIPSDVIKDVVQSDSFFVDNEWRRWVFVKRLINRRLKAIVNELGITPAEAEMILQAPPFLRNEAPRLSARGKGLQTDEESLAWTALYEHPEILPLLQLLDHGIHYMHFEFEQLQHIRSSRDRFGVPLLPDKIISDALWLALELRQKVMNATSHDEDLGLAHPAKLDYTNSTRDALPEYEALKSPTRVQATAGAQSDEDAIPSIMFTNVDISMSRMKPSSSSVPRFWIPSVDCNIMIGGPEPVVTIITPTSASERGPPPSRSGQAPPSNGDRSKCFSHFPPFRFAVELPHPRSVKDDKRIYSRTVFYAGSLWNVYIQKKRPGPGKSPQFGIYMYRAKEQSPEDSAIHYGSVDERIGALEREMILRSPTRPRQTFYTIDDYSRGVVAGVGEADMPEPVIGNFAHTTASALSNFMTGTKQHPTNAPGDQETPEEPVDEGDTSSDSNSDNVSSQNYSQNVGNGPSNALPPYLDTRPLIKSYYRIYCPSQGGRMLSIYESAPDTFKFSQSRGWKCNSLMLDEKEGIVGANYAESTATSIGFDFQTGDADRAGAGYWHFAGQDEYGREISGRDGRKLDGKLRLTVVLGIV